MDEIADITSKVLQSQRDTAKEVVNNLIESEQGYLFTNDLMYLSQRTNLIPAQENAREGQQ